MARGKASYSEMDSSNGYDMEQFEHGLSQKPNAKEDVNCYQIAEMRAKAMSDDVETVTKGMVWSNTVETKDGGTQTYGGGYDVLRKRPDDAFSFGRTKEGKKKLAEMREKNELRQDKRRVGYRDLNDEELSKAFEPKKSEIPKPKPTPVSQGEKVVSQAAKKSKLGRGAKVALGLGAGAAALGAGAYLLGRKKEEKGISKKGEFASGKTIEVKKKGIFSGDKFAKAASAATKEAVSRAENLKKYGTSATSEKELPKRFRELTDKLKEKGLVPGDPSLNTAPSTSPQHDFERGVAAQPALNPDRMKVKELEGPEVVVKGGTIFGKPESEVVKHPGAFKAKAEAAGMGTEEYAHHVMSDPKADTETKRQANLAINFSKMRHSKKEEKGVQGNAGFGAPANSGFQMPNSMVANPGDSNLNRSYNGKTDTVTPADSVDTETKGIVGDVLEHLRPIGNLADDVAQAGVRKLKRDENSPDVKKNYEELEGPTTVTKGILSAITPTKQMAKAGLRGAMGGAATGAATGALSSPEDRVQGALRGAAIGGLSGGALAGTTTHINEKRAVEAIKAARSGQRVPGARRAAVQARGKVADTAQAQGMIGGGIMGTAKLDKPEDPYGYKEFDGPEVVTKGSFKERALQELGHVAHDFHKSCGVGAAIGGVTGAASGAASAPEGGRIRGALAGAGEGSAAGVAATLGTGALLRHSKKIKKLAARDADLAGLGIITGIGSAGAAAGGRAGKNTPEKFYDSEGEPYYVRTKGLADRDYMKGDEFHTEMGPSELVRRELNKAGRKVQLKRAAKLAIPAAIGGTGVYFLKKKIEESRNPKEEKSLKSHLLTAGAALGMGAVLGNQKGKEEGREQTKAEFRQMSPQEQHAFKDPAYEEKRKKSQEDKAERAARQEEKMEREQLKPMGHVPKVGTPKVGKLNIKDKK